MTAALSTPPTWNLDTLSILPWVDPVVEAVGHDPRSPYVEAFWLGILGPSATWLARRLVAGFDRSPDGYEIPWRELAGALGLSTAGAKNSPFARTCQRLVQFGLAQAHSRGLGVRRRLPPLSHRQVERLPIGLQAAHRHWVEGEAGSGRAMARARLLARSMLAVGDEPDAVERQLQLVEVPAPMAAEALRWAMVAGSETDDAA
jgi:hypothetical protein